MLSVQIVRLSVDPYPGLNMLLVMLLCIAILLFVIAVFLRKGLNKEAKNLSNLEEIYREEEEISQEEGTLPVKPKKRPRKFIK